jgi:hypothetical protein
MPVINGVYLKDFTALPGAVADADIIPIAITGDQIAYRTTVAGIVTDARITAKLLTGLSVTGGAVIAADTILEAFGKVQNQINGKQSTITLTTTGTSGAATFISNTLNIPDYGAVLTGYVPYTGANQTLAMGTNNGITLTDTSSNTSISITSSSTGQGAILVTKSGNGEGIRVLNGGIGSGFLSANTSTGIGFYINNSSTGIGLKINNDTSATGDPFIYTLNNVSKAKIDYLGNITGVAGTFTGQLTLGSTITNGTYTYTLPGATGTLALVGGAGVGTVTSVAALTLGTTGTDLSSTVANGTTTPVITLQVPTASASNRGALSSADWSTFNGKQSTITLTTTGTSGAATLVSNTLNIPNYADGGVLSLSAIGGTANANAATITGTVLNLQPASASFGGVVTTGTQTFAGAKTLTGALSGTSATFSGDLTIDTNTLYVDSTNNNVGIGTTSMSSFNAIANQLVVGNGTANQGITISTSTTTLGSLLFADSTVGADAYRGYVQYDHSLDKMSLATNGVARLTIASTGAATFSSSVTAGDSIRINKSSNSGSASTFPVLEIKNSLATQGDGSSTFNFASLYVNSGNDAVNMVVSTTYAAGTWAPAGIIAVTTNHGLQFKTNNTLALTIASTGAATFSSSVTSSLGSSAANFNSNGATTGAVNAYRISNTTGTASFGIDNSTGGDLITGGLAYATILQSISNTALQLGTNQTARLTITSGGNVGIGTTSPAYKLDVNGQIYNQGNSSTSFIIARDYSSGSITLQQFTQNGVGTIGSISFNGTNVLYNSTSDYRLKQDLKDYNALNIISSIKTYDFEWKSNKTRSYGVIAHELAEIMPSIVSGDKDGIDDDGNILPQGLDYSKLVPIMIKAIQELSAEIDLLKGEPIIPTDENLE